MEYYAAVKKNKGCLHTIDGSQHLIMSEVASRGSTQGPQDQLGWTDGSQYVTMSEVASQGPTQGPPGPAVLEDALGCSPGRRHFVELGFGGLFFYAEKGLQRKDFILLCLQPSKLPSHSQCRCCPGSRSRNILHTHVRAGMALPVKKHPR